MYHRRTITISNEELNRRATLRKQGKLSRHFETYEQYLLRLAYMPEETKPIEIVPYSMPISSNLKEKGCFVI